MGYSIYNGSVPIIIIMLISEHLLEGFCPDMPDRIVSRLHCVSQTVEGSRRHRLMAMTLSE